ncbi:MAG: hypothetical protein LBI87_15050, partial [Candidatus Accumulibacter sp.]|nr:hypothetical protein [Accumulibacter sp.]
TRRDYGTTAGKLSVPTAPRSKVKRNGSQPQRARRPRRKANGNFLFFVVPAVFVALVVFVVFVVVNAFRLSS